MRKTIAVFLCVVVCGFAVTGVALAGIPGEKFAQETGSGDYAVAVAAGNVDDPAAIYVTVKSRPTQLVSGAWTVVCSKGFGAGSKSGKIHGTTSLTRALKLPMGNPDSCTASADAQLSDGGVVKVLLSATH